VVLKINSKSPAVVNLVAVNLAHHSELAAKDFNEHRVLGERFLRYLQLAFDTLDPPNPSANSGNADRNISPSR